MLYRAAWVLPIAVPPIRRGSVLTDDERVAGVFKDGELPRFSDSTATVETIDLGDAAILPGLANAHTHLELSWMRGRIPPSDSMPTWAAQLMGLRRERNADPPEPIEQAIAEARAAGTALVGDVTNTLAADRLLGESQLAGAEFFELLGFSAPRPSEQVAEAQSSLAALADRSPWLRSVVPHAPYSVSPDLFRAIAAVAGDRAISVHVGESCDEMEFLETGTGAWRELLGRLGVWSDRWRPPGCGPVEYLDRLGLLNDRLIAVHGTQLADSELARLADAGATLVACARSNRWTGAGVPPIDRFFASGVRVAIGTDSLASVEDLNLFGELAYLRKLAPQIPARQLLASATIAGATALGLSADYGTIEPGKRAQLIAVHIPRHVDDVEEYLVSGVEPTAITWLK